MRLLSAAYSMSISALSICFFGCNLAVCGEQVGSGEFSRPKPNKFNNQTYILGPGDTLQIELLDIPEFSGNFSIGPDGVIFLPRLRSLYVEGLTIDELQYFLTAQFRNFIKKPQVYVRPLGYRPIRVYVGGEVRRPGYYTLRGLETNAGQAQQQISTTFRSPEIDLQSTLAKESVDNFGGNSKLVFPTVFDAIRAAQGISPYSDLTKVQVTRKQALSAGGGHIRTNLDFISLITKGDESQNIRLFDGDVVSVGKSNVVLLDQLLKAGSTNLSPQFIIVFVSGRVNTPGSLTIQQGTTLNQAISVAGGVKLLRGKVEFLRFLSEGKVDRRRFSYSPNAPNESYANPVLAAGDLIRVQDSAFSTSVNILGEVTGPLLGIYSVYALTNSAFR